MIIDGKKISEKILEEIAQEVDSLKKRDIIPGLAIVLVGDDIASKIYVKNKKTACGHVGIYSEEYILPESTSENELLNFIQNLNENNKISGILVQLPLPTHINPERVACAIHPNKDVDAFNPINIGQLTIGNLRFMPCTPAGIVELLKHSKIETSGKNCVILGRSNIVGKPTALMLLQKNATVTICHSKTQNITEICKSADILISAIGQANFVTKNMLKPGAVVIDVGINRDENGKICGDVDFENVKNIASYITPVPGGVGPMTIAMLVKNTLMASKIQNKI